MSRADDDRLTLENLSEREARVADAATRLAWDRVGDWLSQKQTKLEQFPGGDTRSAFMMATAYQNAAQEIYGWAIAHQPE